MIYGYTRVSSPGQARHGQGLAIQAKLIQNYCLGKSMDLDEVFTDEAEHGSTPLEDRPAGRTMLSVLVRGDHVIVSHLSRAWRSTIDAVTTVRRWDTQGVTVHLLDLGIDLSTPAGRLMFTIVAAIAEFERELIRERITAGVRLAISQRNGLWGPTLRYGWQRDESGKIVPNPEEQQINSLLRTLLDEGLSHARMARRLNQLHLTSRNGQPWTKDTVKSALRALDRGTPGTRAQE